MEQVLSAVSAILALLITTSRLDGFDDSSAGSVCGRYLFVDGNCVTAVQPFKAFRTQGMQLPKRSMMHLSADDISGSRGYGSFPLRFNQEGTLYEIPRMGHISG